MPSSRRCSHAGGQSARSQDSHVYAGRRLFFRAAFCAVCARSGRSSAVRGSLRPSGITSRPSVRPSAPTGTRSRCTFSRGPADDRTVPSIAVTRSSGDLMRGILTLPGRQSILLRRSPAPVEWTVVRSGSSAASARRHLKRAGRPPTQPTRLSILARRRILPPHRHALPPHRPRSRAHPGTGRAGGLTPRMCRAAVDRQ